MVLVKTNVHLGGYKSIKTRGKIGAVVGNLLTSKPLMKTVFDQREMSFVNLMPSNLMLAKKRSAISRVCLLLNRRSVDEQQDI